MFVPVQLHLFNVLWPVNHGICEQKVFFFFFAVAWELCNPKHLCFIYYDYLTSVVSLGNGVKLLLACCVPKH